MTMIDLRIAVDSDASQYAEFANQGLVNCYAIGGSKDQTRSPEIHFSSGLTRLLDTGDNVCRGAISVVGATAKEDVAYFGYEGSMQKLTWDGDNYSSISIGIIPGRGQLQFARNAADPFQVGVINSDGRFYLIDNDTIKPGPSSGLPSKWNSITFAGNQIVLGLDDGRMFATNLLDMTAVDGLSFATAESSPDGLVAVAGLGQELFAIGRNTTESWRPNGASEGFPFTPLSGAVSQIGCSAKLSIKEAAGTLYWVTNDGFVGRLESYQIRPVSNRAVDLSISNVSDPETICGYTFTESGQVFYGITHANFTWEYNINSGMWHERKSYRESRWRAQGVIEVFGKNITGDFLTGDVWEIDKTSRVEGEDPLIIEVRSPPVDPQGKLATVDKVEIDAVTGRSFIDGEKVKTSPSIMIDWTDNGYKPYSSERLMTLGRIGDINLPMSTTRLGSIRRGDRRTFRIRCSDPVVSGFLGQIRVFIS